MMILKLTPTDVETNHWKCSTYKGEVIVRPEDVSEARHLAQLSLGIARRQR